MKSLYFRLLGTAFVGLWITFPPSSAANDLIPTLEDAGYAFEATERCGTMSMVTTTTRRLVRASRFRDGRKMFRNAEKQWGRDWACNTALQNLGSEIDLSDYFSGRLIRQPPPSEIPPLPTLRSSVRDRTIVQATD